MIYLKEYYNYDDKVAEICKEFGIYNWSIRDGLVDVNGGVDLWNERLTKLPLKFGRVSGYFECGYNNLTSLEGSPIEVGRNFGCGHNNLTSLKGAPKKVGGYFNCSYNKITKLEHMPNVRDEIYIDGNPLPKEILKLSHEQLKKVVYEQDFYEIWRDGKLFEPRWRELKLDLGLLI